MACRAPALDSRVSRIRVVLEQGLSVSQLKEAVRREFCESTTTATNHPLHDPEAEISRLVTTSNLKGQVENEIFLLSKELTRLLRRRAKGIGVVTSNEGNDVEPLEHVQRAREQWEISLNDELMSIAKERREPLVERASATEHDAQNPPNGPMRFLFDSEDLLDALSHIDSANWTCSQQMPRVWGIVRVQLETPDLNALRRAFPELHPCQRHIGLDDKLPLEVAEGADTSFVTQRVVLGRKVLLRGFIPVVRHYAKFGIPAGLRASMWRVMLGLPTESGPDEKAYFTRLREDVQAYKIATDDLYHMDVENMTDDHRYFPFEEVLESVMLAFSRDAWVRQNSCVVVHRPIVGHWRVADAESGDDDVAVPPSAVLPFRGLVNYAAPLCFLSQAPECVYFVLRAMWAQLWCRVNALRSHDGHLLHVCKCFEDLLLRYHPRLFFHLVSRVGVSPLQLVMPWMQFGFVNLLEPDQVLLLWDRILGYSDTDGGDDRRTPGLLLLAVLAAAVLTFRAQSLLQATDLQSVQDALSDGSRLKVVPLLQLFLFPETMARGEGGGVGVANQTAATATAPAPAAAVP